MFLILNRQPEDNPISYDDITLGYAMTYSITMLATWCAAKGLDVNRFLLNNDVSVSELPLVWAVHSKESFDWLFKFAVHCVSEYYYRTGIESPMYLSLLQQVKDSMQHLTSGIEAEQITWWPLSNPMKTHDIVAFSSTSKNRGWATVQMFELVQKTHQMYYQTMSNKNPNLYWTKRSQPTWLVRF